MRKLSLPVSLFALSFAAATPASSAERPSASFALNPGDVVVFQAERAYEGVESRDATVADVVLLPGQWIGLVAKREGRTTVEIANDRGRPAAAYAVEVGPGERSARVVTLRYGRGAPVAYLCTEATCAPAGPFPRSTGSLPPSR